MAENLSKMPEKAVFVSTKQARRQLRSRMFRRVIFFVVLFALLILLWFISTSPNFQITKVEVKGVLLTPANQVEGMVARELEGKYAFVFPKANKLWYPRKKIHSKLLEEFPRIYKNSITREQSTLVVSIEERKLRYLWCGGTVPQNSEDSFIRGCYFTDQEGFIFATAPNFSDGVYIKLYAPIENQDMPIGQYVFNKEIITHVETLASGITSSQIIPFAYVASKDNDIEILLLGHSSSKAKVLYNPKSDPLDRLQDFRIALNTEPLATKLKNSFSLLEYIDLRFDKKVFYKFAPMLKIEKNQQVQNETVISEF